MSSHVCYGTQCAEIQRLRQLHWKYAAIANALQITVYAVQRSIGIHNQSQANGRASCLDCRRTVHPKTPVGRLLPKDECCGWCGRRFDGNSDLVVPLLVRLAEAASGAPNAEPVQDLRVWDKFKRANSVEIRSRSTARGLV